ncbi:MAG: 4-alpha-glucanotransferase [Deltaproteobacteria bacterium]|jgi:4-alpha-glucanotransferase|nr:4-alpha-glucanotransferase [Deltaproteobacteria bacterium]
MSRFQDGWRAAGLLLHITSLPGPFGIGDLGPKAHAMLDFLQKAGVHFWQVLPVNPTAPALGNSPYSAYSAFAGNELLVSPTLMVEEGWITKADADRARQTQPGQPNRDRVDFETTIKLKSALIDLAYSRVGFGLLDREDFSKFAWDNSAWLNDYSFFMTAKADLGGIPWFEWPDGLKYRDDHELGVHGRRLSEAILRVKFGQFLFFSQLNRLKDGAVRRGIKLMGDTAFYVNHDSSDVWANRHLFRLTPDGQTGKMAGVPPDYFSQTGQLWGNPVFDWPANRESGYGWWLSRLRHNLSMFDWIRLDHFRAFCRYWSVAGKAETAKNGDWEMGPGASLFEAAGGGPLNVVAEDLGVITPDVTELRQKFDFPGMRVLHFGFGPDQPLSTHCPYRIEPDNLVYAATHDNNTTRGWYENDIDYKSRQRISDLAGYQVNSSNVAWTLIRLTYLSSGAISVITVPDLLNLGKDGRLNVPGTVGTGNWAWRLSTMDQLTPALAANLAELGALAGRDDLRHPNVLTY